MRLLARSGPAAEARRAAEAQAIFLALGATIAVHRLPLSPFADLVSAFRQDIQTTRYASWSELLDYCRRSANPVGRLVLRIAGYSDAALDAASDNVCTALQLTNFWQDLGPDFRRGRIYLPATERAAHGAIDDAPAGRRLNGPWRHAIAAATARTRALFAAGRPVCDGVSGLLRYELRATWLGGMRILDHIEQSGYDPVLVRPRLGVADGPWFIWKMVTWSVVRPSSFVVRP